MAITKFCILICLTVCLLGVFSVSTAFSQEGGDLKGSTTMFPPNIILRIVEAEDKRLWNDNLSLLLRVGSRSVIKRAALAAGRIGDEAAVPALVSLLQNDKDHDVRAMAVFALGEIESATAGEALVAELAKREDSNVRARAIEALGKIAAALPASEKVRLASFQKEILNTLEFEATRRSAPDTKTILLGVTAALRARPEGAGKVVAQFLSYSDSRIRADAANALARLRAKDGNEQLRKLLTTDPDPIVRANAARVLGATEDKDAFDSLLDRALKDSDQRVRVSAIRALASLRDSKAASPLLERGRQLKLPADTNEILEIVTTIGRVSQNSNDRAAREWLQQLRRRNAPEVEIALARINPQLYSMDLHGLEVTSDWRSMAAVAQGAAELVNSKTGNPASDGLIKTDAVRILSSHLSCSPKAVSRARMPRQVTPNTVLARTCTPLPTQALPDWLRALAAFKTPDAEDSIREHFEAKDVIVRATAAELLGELPPNETNTRALINALPIALKDQDLDDAALAILDALAKQKNPAANEAIKTALDSSNHLIQRRAVSLLKANNAGDFSARLGVVQARNTQTDYERAISRAGKKVRAIVSTSKGSFAIDLFPEQAPLTVDNFVQLAKRGYFKGISFHRVVPNFVIQGGDPRGDGSGGPGHAIRCEINLLPYDRGAVGMALSGKDTGGSQWFVTHSPQPHLDGGYTVFGKVFDGIEVVDVIERGDVIKSIVVTSNGKPEPK